MNYLYFAEGAVETTGEACMYPASSFIGFDPISATTTRLSFKARNCTDVDDDVLIQHASGKHKEVAELISSVLKPSPVTRTKFIVVADEANSVYLDNGNGAGLTGTVEVTTIA
jgi:hypothetical protein|tara:strand:- start:1044 stop:1382 length:339 start_codon:yes stop_codon:yes gene_type:complete